MAHKTGLFKFVRKIQLENSNISQKSNVPRRLDSKTQTLCKTIFLPAWYSNEFFRLLKQPLTRLFGHHYQILSFLLIKNRFLFAWFLFAIINEERFKRKTFCLLYPLSATKNFKETFVFFWNEGCFNMGRKVFQTLMNFLDKLNM